MWATCLDTTPKYIDFFIASSSIVNDRQAIACYVPQWLWNMWEGGLINTLVMGMNHGLDHKEEISKKKGILMDYLVSHIRVRKIWRVTFSWMKMSCSKKFIYVIDKKSWYTWISETIVYLSIVNETHVTESRGKKIKNWQHFVVVLYICRNYQSVHYTRMCKV